MAAAVLRRTDQAARLPDRVELYFEVDASTVLLELDVLETTRARPEGIANAERLMAEAALGTQQRRAPIHVKRDGRRDFVLDGNSTTIVARRHGFRRLPAHVDD
jgi:hypothetical protein